MPKIGNILTEKTVKPNKTNQTRIFPASADDEIVISGLGGRYPSCDNAEDLRHHLYNKVGFLCTFRTVEKCRHKLFF